MCVCVCVCVCISYLYDHKLEDEISSTRAPYGGEMHTDLDGEPEGKEPLGRPRPRREDSLKMDVQQIWWKGVLG